MKNIAAIDFEKMSFDDLSSLAITDQVKFEELRVALIDRVINVAGSNADQLAALQSRLDEGGDTGTPRYLACLRLSEWLDEPYRRLAQQLDVAQLQEQANG